MKTHCLPFSQIPHTTRLFLDFLAYSSKVQPFYPRSPFFSEWMRDEAAKISYDSPRRERVSSILERQNKSWDASPKTLANLERLRKVRPRLSPDNKSAFSAVRCSPFTKRLRRQACGTGHCRG